MQDFITTQLYNDKEWENALENGFRPAPATGTPADRLRLLLEGGMKDEAEETKKKALVWREKLEADHKSGIAS